jgi:acetoin utilization deacetylase AcuC-like enzyme
MATSRVGWIYDRRFLQHDTGEDHLESPQRLEAIVTAFERSGLLRRMEALDFRSASFEELALAHEPAYVDLVRMMCDSGFYFVGSPDTRVCTWSYDVAAAAAGGVLAACNAVMAGDVQRAFCAVRPPGHHAEADQAMGFCLFNNVAIGAEHLIRHHGLTRVAIVDFDVHHGNGTQHIFENRSDVLYVSLHERPGSLEFPGTGEAHERGYGPGTGYTLNVPLKRGSGETEYLAALREQVLPALDRFTAEFLLVSAGFDALMFDRVSNMNLNASSYGPITELLVQAALRHTAGRMVSVLEGGYYLPDLGPAAETHVRAMMET